MILETSFDIGEKVYVSYTFNNEKVIRGPYTIGQVSKEVIDSPGIPFSEFTNYQQQKSERETYMLVETGIGTGSVWRASQLSRNEPTV
jgi:hypothetical protein